MKIQIHIMCHVVHFFHVVHFVRVVHVVHAFHKCRYPSSVRSTVAAAASVHHWWCRLKLRSKVQVRSGWLIGIDKMFRMGWLF